MFDVCRSYNVSYHNDLHNLDVAQMTYILLKTGPDSLAIQLRLPTLEIVAIIVAALCHDYGHDGLNNGYHIAAQSARFLAHGSDGVQEKFHFAESFKCIEETQLLEGLNSNDLNIFKERMQNCIYATDMAKHMGIINEIKSIVEVPAVASAF